MSLGVTVTSRLAPPARGAETDISAWHIVFVGTVTGTANTVYTLHSLADFATAFGVRASGNQLAYDSVDAFFREGGRTVYAVKATDNTAYAAALAVLPDKPGQVSIIDPTPASTHWTMLDTHAIAFNKRALYDITDGQTVAQTVTAAANLVDDRYGAAFGPWVKIPGAGGTAREIPASGVVAGLIARVDAQGNPNRAAAGRRFGLQYVQGFKKDYSLADANSLSAVGVNALREVYGVNEVYGFDTPGYTATTPDTTLGQFNASRTEMYIIAQGKSIGENYMFEPIDGQGHTAADLKSDLDGMLLDLWRVGGLYGATAAEAFAVDISTVNDEQTAEAARLRAVCSVRPTQHARSVEIELVNVPVNVAV